MAAAEKQPLTKITAVYYHTFLEVFGIIKALICILGG